MKKLTILVFIVAGNALNGAISGLATGLIMVGLLLSSSVSTIPVFDIRLAQTAAAGSSTLRQGDAIFGPVTALLAATGVGAALGAVLGIMVALVAGLLLAGATLPLSENAWKRIGLGGRGVAGLVVLFSAGLLMIDSDIMTDFGGADPLLPVMLFIALPAFALVLGNALAVNRILARIHMPEEATLSVAEMIDRQDQRVQPAAIARPTTWAQRIAGNLCILLCILLMLPIVVFNINLRLPRFEDGLATDTEAQLIFLQDAVDRGMAGQMQASFPEGYFFTVGLTADAWLGYAETLPRTEGDYLIALREARDGIELLDGRLGRAPFDALLTPPYGVFYNGWMAWFEGHYLQLIAASEREITLENRFQARCAALAAAFDDSDTPFLRAYPDGSWPVDSTVAIAALQLHDSLYRPLYSETIARWLDMAQARLDPMTGLLPHRVDAQTGDAIIGPRGTSSSLMSRFLPIIDAAFGNEMYLRFRDSFVMAGLGVREYPHGTSGEGDVDSGPLLFGISAPTSVMAIGAARAGNDLPLAEDLIHGINAFGFPLPTGNRGKAYALGQLPVADAIIVWNKTTPVVVTTGVVPLPTGPWRLLYHAGSLLLLALLTLPVVLIARRRISRHSRWSNSY